MYTVNVKPSRIKKKKEVHKNEVKRQLFLARSFKNQSYD